MKKTIITITILFLLSLSLSTNLKAEDTKPTNADDLKKIAIKAAKNNAKYCNKSVAEVARAYSIKDLDGLDADAQINFMTSNWEAVDQSKAMQLANEGKLVVAGLKSGDSSYYQLDDTTIGKLEKVITDKDKIKSLKAFRDKNMVGDSKKPKKYSEKSLTKELGDLKFTSDEIKKILDTALHTEEHGHVAIVFPGTDSQGRMLLAGGGNAYSEGDKSINMIWIEAVRDRVKFYTPKEDTSYKSPSEYQQGWRGPGWYGFAYLCCDSWEGEMTWVDNEKNYNDFLKSFNDDSDTCNCGKRTVWGMIFINNNNPPPK